jgi:inositol hexakisphosphate/diphosphoinositol-pentakisphosphate kinase
MRGIVASLRARDAFEVLLFPESVIINSPVEDWPLCDYLLCFESKGFPLEKGANLPRRSRSSTTNTAVKYVELRRPVTINDVARQTDLLNRDMVIKQLEAAGVRTSRSFVIDHLDALQASDVVESTDYIRVSSAINDGVVRSPIRCCLAQFRNETLEKPFVEKPLDANNHDIVIYRRDGTSQRLLRKKDDGVNSVIESSLCDYLRAAGIDLRSPLQTLL